MNPIVAGCWHCVPAMTQGFDVLCGPIVLPATGPVNVSGIALAAPASANVRKTAKLSLVMHFIVGPLSTLKALL